MRLRATRQPQRGDLRQRRLPLDFLPFAAAGFALRRLRWDYLGAAIRVRRSSDNAEMDIGFADVGPNLISNGDFANGATGWTLGSGVTVTGGAVSAGGATQIALQNCGLVQGRTYWFSFDFNCTSGSSIRVNNSTVNEAATVYERTSVVGRSGTIQGAFVAVNSTGVFSIEASFAFYGGTIDNVVVRQVSVGSTDLNIAALANFIAPSNTSQAAVPSGFVPTWYDQSLFARHATQTGPALQPRIVNAGVVETKLSRPTVRFLGGNCCLTIANRPLTLALDLSVSSVFNAETSDNFEMIFSQSNGTGDAGNVELRRRDINDSLEVVYGPSQAGFVRVLTGAINNVNHIITSVRRSGIDVNSWFEGSLADSALSANVTPIVDSIANIGGRGGSLCMNGTISELLLFKVALTDASRLLLERNQGAYYGIAVA